MIFFKDVVKENFASYLPQEYADAKIEFSSIEKINKTFDSVTLRPKNAENMQACPCIYLNDLYNEFNISKDMDSVLQNAMNNLITALNKKEQPQFALSDKEEVAKTIVFQLINTRQNESLLANVPHKEFHDLSIVYKWITHNNGEMYSALINNAFAEHLNLTEEELFKLASQNTSKVLPPIIKPMNEILRESLIEDGMPEEMAKMMTMMVPSELEQMLVITNKEKLFGASVILDNNIIHQAAEKMGDDLYILPSSLHEVIAVPASIDSPEAVAEIVTEINGTAVDLEDRLSNQICYYDKALKELSLVTNKEKGIDDSDYENDREW